jgi:hypothetical protein
LNNINTIIFDCDGVILNSNKVKKDAYYNVALNYIGKKYANLLTEYLSINSGHTRKYILSNFVNNIVSIDLIKVGVDELVNEVSKEVIVGLE